MSSDNIIDNIKKYLIKLKSLIYSSSSTPSEKKTAEANLLNKFFSNYKGVFDFIKNPTNPNHAPPGVLYFMYVMISFIGICVTIFGFKWLKKLFNDDFMPFLTSQQESLQVWAAKETSDHYKKIRKTQYDESFIHKFRKIRQEEKLKLMKEQAGWFRWTTDKFKSIPHNIADDVTYIKGKVSNGIISAMFMAYLSGVSVGIPPFFSGSVKLQQVMVAVVIKFVLIVYYFMKNLIDTEILGVGQAPFYKRLYDNLLTSYYNLLSLHVVGIDIAEIERNSPNDKQKSVIKEASLIKNRLKNLNHLCYLISSNNNNNNNNNSFLDQEIEKMINNKKQQENYKQLIMNLCTVRNLRKLSKKINSQTTLEGLKRLDYSKKHKNIFDEQNANDEDHENEDDQENKDEIWTSTPIFEDNKKSDEENMRAINETAIRAEEFDSKENTIITELTKGYKENVKDKNLQFYEIEDLLSHGLNGPNKKVKKWKGLRETIYDSSVFDVKVVKMMNLLISSVIDLHVLVKQTFNDCKKEAEILDEIMKDEEKSETKGQNKPKIFSVSLRSKLGHEQLEKIKDLLESMKESSNIEKLNLLRTYFVKKIIGPVGKIIDSGDGVEEEKKEKGEDKEEEKKNDKKNDEEDEDEDEIKEDEIKEEEKEETKCKQFMNKFVVPFCDLKKFSPEKNIYFFIPKSERKATDKMITDFKKNNESIPQTLIEKAISYKTKYMSVATNIIIKHKLLLQLWNSLCFVINYEINLFFITILMFELFVQNSELTLRGTELLTNLDYKVLINILKNNTKPAEKTAQRETDEKTYDMDHYSAVDKFYMSKNVTFSMIESVRQTFFSKNDNQKIYENSLQVLINISCLWLRQYWKLIKKNFYKVDVTLASLKDELNISKKLFVSPDTCPRPVEDSGVESCTNTNNELDTVNDEQMEKELNTILKDVIFNNNNKTLRILNNKE